MQQPTRHRTRAGTNVVDLEPEGPRYVNVDRIPVRELIELAATEILVVISALEIATRTNEQARQAIDLPRLRKARSRLTTIWGRL